MLGQIKKFFAAPLTIKVHDYNAIDDEFISMLRLLTIRSTSGMNHELNAFAEIKKTRDVHCKIFTAWRDKEFVGWALLSAEASDFSFRTAYDGFKPNNELMFQVFVAYHCRRQGIASKLLETANKHLGGKKIAVCPHDSASQGFYKKHHEAFTPNYL